MIDARNDDCIKLYANTRSVKIDASGMLYSFSFFRDFRLDEIDHEGHIKRADYIVNDSTITWHPNAATIPAFLDLIVTSGSRVIDSIHERKKFKIIQVGRNDDQA